jgi:Icc-related predicted phosphoesterase
MKLNIMSDLHLEFGNMNVPEGDGTLILAGDIHVGTKATDFIAKALDTYDNVLYVLGNHEFYHNDYNKVIDWWLKAASLKSNFHVLHNSSVVIEGVPFIGTTLWTPADGYGLNDFNYITYNGKTLTPKNTQQFYLEAVKFLEEEVPKHKDCVVITHHAPVEACVVEHYKGDPFNKFFHCNLEEFIKANDIALWVHGHMHDSIYIEQDGTTIVCNPRGYNDGWGNKKFETPFIFDL